MSEYQAAYDELRKLKRRRKERRRWDAYINSLAGYHPLAKSEAGWLHDAWEFLFPDTEDPDLYG